MQQRRRIKIDRLTKKEKELAIISLKLKIEERKRKIYMSDISKIKQKERKRKIFQAGLLFEEAGILDTYSKSNALAALKALNPNIIQRGENSER